MQVVVTYLREGRREQRTYGSVSAALDELFNQLDCPDPDACGTPLLLERDGEPVYDSEALHRLHVNHHVRRQQHQAAEEARQRPRDTRFP